MRLPENVVENNLSEMPPPDNYAGLIYRWTDLINYEIYVSSGKEQEVPIYYLGSHGSDKELTAFVGDGYWHSSKNKDFEKVFSDPNSRLRYEILEYFDLKHDMNQKEHTMLDKVDAKNNPLYYNMNNGIVTSKEPRLSLCQEFLSDVNPCIINPFPLLIEPDIKLSLPLIYKLLPTKSIDCVVKVILAISPSVLKNSNLKSNISSA